LRLTASLAGGEGERQARARAGSQVTDDRSQLVDAGLRILRVDRNPVATPSGPGCADSSIAARDSERSLSTFWVLCPYASPSSPPVDSPMADIVPAR
jgi:hypothetical protein